MNNLIRTVRSKRIDNEQSRFQTEQETCVLCDTNLEVKIEKLNHDAASASGRCTVREVAECPKCRVRARSKDHELQ